MPRIHRVLETSLYVEDLQRAHAFYQEVLQLPTMAESDRFVALDAGSGSVLLLFRRGGSLQTLDHQGQRIPPHDGEGPLHIALAIGADEQDGWERHLESRGCRSRAGSSGLAGGPACTSATRTGTVSNSRRRGCGRCTELDPTDRATSRLGRSRSLASQVTPALHPGDDAS